MPVKNAVAKTWTLSISQDGLKWSGYPAGDKPGPALLLTESGFPLLTEAGVLLMVQDATPVGPPVYPLLTESGVPLLTESGNMLLME